MSDQDFFFDEDEKPAKSAGTSAPRRRVIVFPSGPALSSAGACSAQSVSMTVAVLIGVIGILLGAVIGLFVGKSMAVPPCRHPGRGRNDHRPAGSAAHPRAAPGWRASCRSPVRRRRGDRHPGTVALAQQSSRARRSAS